MAKATAVRVVRIPPPKVVTVGRRFGRTRAFLRRAGSVAAARVRDEKHTLTAIGSAAALGYIEKVSPGALDALTLGPLRPDATIGLLCWFGNRWVHSRTLEHVATGLLSVAAYNLAKSGFESSGDWAE